MDLYNWHESQKTEAESKQTSIFGLQTFFIKNSIILFSLDPQQYKKAHPFTNSLVQLLLFHLQKKQIR